jgi:antitoxin MazE
MSAIVLKVSRIGNSRGIRLPAAMLRKYHIGDTIVAEEKASEIVLRPGGTKPKKLSWEETAREMAAAKEDWSEWDCTLADGLGEIPWEGRAPQNAFSRSKGKRGGGK